MKLTSKASIIGAFGLTALAATTASAETVLRYSPWLPASYVINAPAIMPWIEEVSRVTDGRVTIEVLPKAVGSAPAQYDMVRDGAADVSIVLTGYSPGRFDLMEFGELPLQAEGVSNPSPVFYEMFSESIAPLDPFPGTHVLTAFLSAPSHIVTDIPVRSVEDMAGLKLRSPSSTSIAIIEALGANPIQKPVTEMYELASSGIIDGTFFAHSALFSWKVTDLLQNVTVVPGGMGQSVMVLVANEGKWNQISEEDQNAIMEISGVALSTAAGAAFEASEDEAKAKLPEAGVTVIDASPEMSLELSERLEAIDAAWIAKAQSAGLNDPAAFLKDFRSKIGNAPTN